MRGTRTTIAGIVCHQVNHAPPQEPHWAVGGRDMGDGAGGRRAGRAKGRNAAGSTAGLQLGGSSQRHAILHSVARAPDLADKVPQKSPDRSRGSCRTIIGRKPMIG